MKERHRRSDVVARAVDVLDEHGLAELSMRRLAGELGVRASALYHHVANKDELLAAVADEVLERGRRAAEVVTWESELRLAAVELRSAMLAHRDGAALISQVYAAGGARLPEQRMRDALLRGGATAELARVGARTLVHFVLGHVGDEQASSETPDGGLADDLADDFAVGLGLILDGLAQRFTR
ncbi:MAG: TetR family transcriptional regulator [Nocardioidaceae bacterium]|nr:TetR family transcriptional regulator [Nocardioidaceae bacterium]MCL2612644.1 TetR family transcriptional regulator [Nocardioidaceae bacterium]